MLRGKALGRAAEDWVAARLTEAGWRTMDRNWSCALGELDLVCATGSTVVFVEVRAVSTHYLDTAAQTVSAPKQRRLARAAQTWLQSRASWPESVRFDVVAVSWDAVKGFRAEHIESAFESPYAF